MAIVQTVSLKMDQCSTGKLDIKGYKLRIFCLDVE